MYACKLVPMTFYLVQFKYRNFPENEIFLPQQNSNLLLKSYDDFKEKLAGLMSHMIFKV